VTDKGSISCDFLDRQSLLQIHHRVCPGSMHTRSPLLLLRTRHTTLRSQHGSQISFGRDARGMRFHIVGKRVWVRRFGGWRRDLLVRELMKAIARGRRCYCFLDRDLWA
jgi:hypothetical protein